MEYRLQTSTRIAVIQSVEAAYLKEKGHKWCVMIYNLESGQFLKAHLLNDAIIPTFESYAALIEYLKRNSS